MIQQMKKVYLVVQDRYRKDAMTKLRHIGVMHVEKESPQSEGLNDAIDKLSNAEEAMSLILMFKEPKKQKKNKGETERETGPWNRQKTPDGKRGRRSTDKYSEEDEPYSLDAINAPTRPHLVDLMLDINTERKELEDQIIILERERDRIAGWGEFDPDQIREMNQKGYPIYLYEISSDSFKDIPGTTTFLIIKETPVVTRFVVIDKEIPGVTPFVLPEKKLSQVVLELEDIYKKKKALDDRIESFADRRPVLKNEFNIVQSEVDFEETLASCEVIDDMPVDASCCCLKGYVLTERMDDLKKTAKENGWAYVAMDPGPEDATPTLLKNNKAVNLLNPITGFLELLPGYKEVDISLWFLMFLSIFFGMIFGDAGYGSLLFVIALIGIVKTAKKGVPLAFKVLCLFSITNMIWGSLTCTWFGIETQLLPPFLVDISLSYITTAKGGSQAHADFFIKLFCFSLALVHLSIAHLIKFFRFIRTGNLRFLAELGTIAILCGMYNLVLVLVGSDKNIYTFEFYTYSLYAIVGGFAVSFLFANYEGSFIKGVVASLKNLFPAVLGVISNFSDIMSYIRLWAVAMAGSAIAETMNLLAGPLLGNLAFFAFGVLILVAGHGLNIILSVLSVLVHGVRLNILEFSSHVGLTWAGVPYKPFVEMEKKLNRGE